MSATELTSAPPKKTPPTAEPPPGPIAAEVQEEIDKLCAGVAGGLRGGLEQFAQASRRCADRAAAKARTDSLELLAEAVRRIRAEESVTAVAGALIDACALFCGRAALLIRKGEKMLGFRAAGGGAQPAGDALQQLTFSVSAAPALEHAVDTCDIVETTGAPANLSAELAAAFQYGESERVYAYPLRLRDKVLGVVLIDEAGKTPVEPAAVEVLVAAAEAWIEAAFARRKTAAAA